MNLRTVDKNARAVQDTGLISGPEDSTQMQSDQASAIHDYSKPVL